MDEFKEVPKGKNQEWRKTGTRSLTRFEKKYTDESTGTYVIEAKEMWRRLNRKITVETSRSGDKRRRETVLEGGKEERVQYEISHPAEIAGVSQ